MREGLRSTRSQVELEIDKQSVSQVLVQKEIDDKTQKGSHSIEAESLQEILDCDGSGEEALRLDGEKKKFVSVDTNCGEVAVANGCTVVEVEDIENIGIEENNGREERLSVIDSNTWISGRVLRSRGMVTSGDNSLDARMESGGVVTARKNIKSEERGKQSMNQVVFQKKIDDETQKGSHFIEEESLHKILDCDGSGEDVLGLEDDKQILVPVDTNGGEVTVATGCTVVEIEGIVDIGIEEKKVGEERLSVIDNYTRISGRVLRSRLIVTGSDARTESGGVLTAESSIKIKGCEKDRLMVELHESDRSDIKSQIKSKCKRGRPPKVQDTITPPKMELDEGVLGAQKNSKRAEREEDEDGKLLGTLKKKIKRKRGRPPKVKKCYEDREVQDTIAIPKIEIDDEVLGSHNKSKGVEMEEDETSKFVGIEKKKFKRKRGRPPKVQEGYGDLEMDTIKEDMLEGKNRSKKIKTEEKKNVVLVGKLKKKLKRKRGRPPKSSESSGSLNVDKVDMALRSKESKKGTEIVKKISKGLGPKKINTIAPKEDEGGNKSRSEAKQVVRERIKSMLLSAGWTVDYRPRYGRAYDDAVYINPKGKTHWSVTLAYNKLKEQYEDGDKDFETCKTGFTFTPIPEEELNMLTRVVTKKRTSKKKLSEAGNSVISADILDNKKRHNEKLGYSANSSGKSLKGRMRRKPLLFERDDSTGRSDKGTSLSSRNLKRQVHKRKRCALLARNSKEGFESNSDGYIPYNGKRTVLSWLIDSGIVPLNGKVMYKNQIRKAKIFHGWITREGIRCDCCSKILTITKFEAHAGSKLSQPFQNIYLESGTSLFQCQLDSWNEQEESERKGFHFIDVEGEDPNDDTCSICGDGGDLICCDGCPSTFHQSCLDIDKFPSGEWHCVYCSCKFCGRAGGNTCRSDGGGDKANPALLTCFLCEQKFHKSCIPAVSASDDDDPCSQSFCNENCEELFERLEMLLGVKQDLEEGFSWTLIHRSDVSTDLSLTGMHQKVECNSKLAVALSIMDECFLPLIDHRSGDNLIRNILYNFGSNFNRLNFRGFVTAILERDDEIIAAASIRIHGNQLAEMPFIGTRHMYRRQGMCRRLLNAIEAALCSLNVDKLVIPAISELRQTWTSVFGFKSLEASSKQKMRNLNLLVFPGVDMLQKQLISHLYKETFPSPGLGSADFEKGKQTMIGLGNYSDRKCTSSGEAACLAHKANGRQASGSGVLCPDNDASDLTNKLVTLLDHANDKPPSTQLEDTCDKSLGCVHLTEVVSNNQNHICCSNGQAYDSWIGELDSQLNKPDMPELECQSVVVSCVEPVATSFNEKSTHALREGTENANCNRKIGSIDRSSARSCYKGSVEHHVQSVTELHEVASFCQSQFSGENLVCHESVTSDHTCLEQLVGSEFMHDSDEKILSISGFKDVSDIAPHGIQPESTCGISDDVIHSTSLSEKQKELGIAKDYFQTDKTSGAQCTADSFCTSKPGSAVALPCASSEVNACGAADALIISNPGR